MAPYTRVLALILLADSGSIMASSRAVLATLEHADLSGWFGVKSQMIEVARNVGSMWFVA